MQKCAKIKQIQQFINKLTECFIVLRQVLGMKKLSNYAAVTYMSVKHCYSCWELYRDLGIFLDQSQTKAMTVTTTMTEPGEHDGHRIKIFWRTALEPLK